MTTLTRRSVLAGGLAALAATGGGTAWALDRFVIEHAEVTDASGQWDDSAASTASSDATASVTVTKRTMGSGSNLVTYFVAELNLNQGTALRAAFAKDTFGENIIENTSVIAKANNAAWAINGDYYGFRSTGIVIRNGIAFRDKGARQGLAVQRDGTVGRVRRSRGASRFPPPVRAPGHRRPGRQLQPAGAAVGGGRPVGAGETPGRGVPVLGELRRPAARGVPVRGGGGGGSHGRRRSRRPFEGICCPRGASRRLSDAREPAPDATGVQT